MNEQNTPQPNEFIQSSKHIWITIIAVVVTTIVISGIFYAWQRSILWSTEQSLQQQITELENQITNLQKPTQAAPTTPKETQEPTQPTDETANWKTYTYKNVSFKYPENWIVVFDSRVAGQPNGFSLHVTRFGEAYFAADQLGLSTYNDRSGTPDDYVLNNDRIFSSRESGDSYIKFVTNNATLYAGCGYYSKGEATREICNKIIKTVVIK